MEVTIADIKKYLEEVKAAINAGKYKIEMNDKRQDKQLYSKLYEMYVREHFSSHRKARAYAQRLFHVCGCSYDTVNFL